MYLEATDYFIQQFINNEEIWKKLLLGNPYT